MKRSDFTFELPAELIAQTPPAERAGARLLVVGEQATQDERIRDLTAHLRAGDLMIFNDTRVIPARLQAVKETGGAAEVMVERIIDEQHAWAFVRASKTPKPGARLQMGSAQMTVLERNEQFFLLELSGATWLELVETHGRIPLPPYIHREPDASDKARYQTVFAREPGAVAAPTAGLHFDEALLAAVDAVGVTRRFLTLHVGAGTFAPMRAESLAEHRMHAERVQVTADLVDEIARTRAAGGRVIAVGTTVVRALETAAADGELRPFTGDSRLFITPGYRFQVVDALLTNFHLPESTLLMLVCAFSGTERVLAAYRHAVAQGYRFFSYGDAMWLERTHEI